ncbi:MAG: glycosyltransferase [Thiocapsa sp.]|uniref:glycosyltransferase n=1 Tax=Thiocapsa sp. TaxID=2024551 RepID=UPI001BD096A2|nr:glycosyltransferase [Thiocapsa sp.]QVL50075.1 MAG: glycosyltransferase [Thiocapsa sp.]
MQILHIIRGLANSSGTTHIVVPLSEAQARLGHAVTVMHVRKGAEPLVEPDPALVASRCFSESPPMGHLGPSLGYARALRHEIAGFDVVHLHAVWNFPTWYGMRTALRAGVPYMVAPQGSLEPWAFGHGRALRRLWARWLELPLLARATRLQALTETEASQMRAFGLEVPAAIIPNGVGTDWLEGERGDLAGRLGLPAGTRTLLFLSRVHPKKGLDVLLRAFAAAALEGVVLVVAGDDAGSGYAGQMRALAAELGLDERCRFIGEVRGEEKRALLLGADAYALTSHSEGLPVAVVEAMASALPVLITPGCNIPQVADVGAGLIVPPEVEAVADGLRTLFADPARMRAWGEQGRALVRERFTWPEIARQTVEVYREMVAQARG